MPAEVVLWSDERVEIVTKYAYELDDVELVEMLLGMLSHAHSLAEQTGEQAIHNTVTVSKCLFEAIAARWLPIEEVVAPAIRKLLDNAAVAEEWADA